QALRAFRNGKIDVLVATDVAARGIDVENVTHVFNFQAPEDENTYLHRVGRTGRAGHKGIAVTLVDWEDVPRWKLIAQALGIEQVEPVETYSASPHLYQDLDIPEDAKGRLPKSQRTREGLDAEKAERLGGPTVNVVVAVAVNTVDASLVDAVAAGVPRTVSPSVHALVNRSTIPAVTNNSPRPANVGSVPVHVDIMVKLYGAILLGSRTTHR